MILYGPPGLGEDDAGPDRRAHDRRRVRGAVGGLRDGRERAPGARAGSRAPRRQRPPDDPLPRRDPPLQQGPAGCAAARRRGRAADADRRDDREPVLRGQLGAALAGPDLRARSALAGDAAARHAPRRSRARDRGGARGRGADRAARRRRRAERAQHPRADRRDGAGRRAATLGRHVETRRGSARSPTTRAAIAHYDFISAWIKATRASDVQASRLLPRRDARRRRGRALHRAPDDRARLRGHRQRRPAGAAVAVAAAHAVEHVGLPEARHNLAQATVYLARAPKSNASYVALGRAIKDVRERGNLLPPAALRSAAYPGAKALGRGAGYVYPHDDPAASTSTACRTS